MIDYSLILRKLYKAEWTLDGNDYDNLVWLDDSKKPTQAELDAKWDEVQALVLNEKQAKIDAKEAAEAKLAALGLTPADLKALGF